MDVVWTNACNCCAISNSPYGDVHGCRVSVLCTVCDERALDFFECWLKEQDESVVYGAHYAAELDYLKRVRDGRVRRALRGRAVENSRNTDLLLPTSV